MTEGIAKKSEKGMIKVAGVPKGTTILVYDSSGRVVDKLECY